MSERDDIWKVLDEAEADMQAYRHRTVRAIVLTAAGVLVAWLVVGVLL